MLKIYETYGGHREETKLLEELSRLDLSVYQRTTGPRDSVLVFTDELNEAMRGR
tara:strand:- start:31 stop:192 length:162 start_codon:yes stop_codon:yes gene_type:complete